MAGKANEVDLDRNQERPAQDEGVARARNEVLGLGTVPYPRRLPNKEGVPGRTPPLREVVCAAKAL